MLSAEERLRNSPAEKPRVYPAAGREDWGGFPSSGPVGSTRPLRRSSALSTKAAPRKAEAMYSAQAEFALLGCVLVDDFEVWGELEEHPIEADDFFFLEHKAIWRAFRWLYEQGMEVTMPSTTYALQQTGALDAVDKWVEASSGLPGVEPYLVYLWDSCFSAKGSGTFIHVVKEYSERRKMMAKAQRLARAAHEPRESWKTLPQYMGELE